MPNTKILVNFRDQKIIHTEAHAGSTEYVGLIKAGYVKVGTVKAVSLSDPYISQTFESVIEAYWESDYFDPGAKYNKEPNNFGK